MTKQAPAAIQSEQEYQTVSRDFTTACEHPLFGDCKGDQRYYDENVERLTQWREANPEPVTEPKECHKPTLTEQGFWKS